MPSSTLTGEVWARLGRVNLRDIAPGGKSQALQLQARILGIFLQQQRQAHGATLEGCAAYLHLSPATVLAWEQGQSAPSLLQVLQLVRLYSGEASTAAPGSEWYRLQTRILGATLRRERVAQALGLADLSASCGLTEELLQRYELGESSIALHHLVALAQALGWDAQGLFAPSVAANIVPDTKSGLDETPERNTAIMRLTQAFYAMQLEDLQNIAGALDCIIQQRRSAAGTG